MEKEAPPPPSAAEGAKSARRVVAKHLWLLARRSRSCQVHPSPNPNPNLNPNPNPSPSPSQVDELIEQVVPPRRKQVGPVGPQLPLGRPPANPNPNQLALRTSQLTLNS